MHYTFHYALTTQTTTFYSATAKPVSHNPFTTICFIELLGTGSTSGAAKTIAHLEVFILMR